MSVSLSFFTTKPTQFDNLFDIVFKIIYWPANNLRLATIFDHNFQSTGSSPFSLNIIFTLENGFEPKNPLFAVKGEGWALLITELS